MRQAWRSGTQEMPKWLGAGKELALGVAPAMVSPAVETGRSIRGVLGVRAAADQCGGVLRGSSGADAESLTGTHCDRGPAPMGVPVHPTEVKQGTPYDVPAREKQTVPAAAALRQSNEGTQSINPPEL
jgi:hypothetical protein